MRIVIKRREFDFIHAPVAETAGYVACVGNKTVGRFTAPMAAARAAAEADYAMHRGERGGAHVYWDREAAPRPAGAMKPGRTIRVCYRIRRDGSRGRLSS